jgi:hypothetical protein
MGGQQYFAVSSFGVEFDGGSGGGDKVAFSTCFSPFFLISGTENAV